MTIGTMCVLQLAVGAWIDRRYDPSIVRMAPYAIWYRIVYWMLLALAAVVSLPWLLRRPQLRSVRWDTRRVGAGA